MFSLFYNLVVVVVVLFQILEEIYHGSVLLYSTLVVVIVFRMSLGHTVVVGFDVVNWKTIVLYLPFQRPSHIFCTFLLDYEVRKFVTRIRNGVLIIFT